MGRLARLSGAVAAAAAGMAVVLAAGLLPSTGAAEWTPVPSYEAAKTDHPAIYLNGCNAGVSTLTPRVCTMLNPSASRTVLLFGDSHAAAWYGAVIGSAQQHGWRVRTLTKSGCSPLAMPIRRYKSTITYTECGTWRWRALEALAAGAYGRADVVVISSWQLHDVLSSWSGGSRLTGEAKLDRWESALRTTLRKVLGSGKQVIVLRDAPQLPFDRYGAQACFVTWGSQAGTKCGTTYSKAMRAGIWRAEQAAAASFPNRVRAVDLTTFQCPDSWCGPLWGRYLMFKDDNHWTQTYVRVRLTSPLDGVLVPAMARANP
jgi:hypothetical protein